MVGRDELLVVAGCHHFGVVYSGTGGAQPSAGSLFMLLSKLTDNSAISRVIGKSTGHHRCRPT